MSPSLKMQKSLSRRIFWGILIFALAGIVVFSLAIGAIFYVSFERDASERLLAQAHTAAQHLDNATQDECIEILEEQFDGGIRYTLIAKDGTVEFDSAAQNPKDTTQPNQANHGDRPEVIEALANGEGSTRRYSSTLRTDTIYAAAALNNGSVVRLSETRESLFAFFMNGLLLPLALAFLIAIILVLVLSRLITRSIMRPLNDMDVASPLDSPVYAEMEPLLARIDSQQKMLKAQNQELALAESLRRDFSANVSHEMKTPLQVISGYAELMAHGMVPPEDVQQFGGVIHQEAQAMRALINDVLILSRLDEQAMDPARATAVDLGSLAQHTIDRLQKPAADAQVTVTLEVKPVHLQGDATLLEQMIYNLVENAVRYNYEGGTVVVRVFEETADEGQLGAGVVDIAKTAVIQVSNSGPGIPPEAQEKVFERFYRLEKSRSKETGGTGLGLAIVKHAALHHGGAVFLESSEEEGTTFTVHLPIVA